MDFFPRPLLYIIIIVTRQTPKSFKMKTFTTFWLENIEVWFCYAEADLHEHGVTHICALLRGFNRYITLGMFTIDVLEPYETLKILFLSVEI